LHHRSVALALIVVLSLLGSSGARATTLSFSDASSDSTPADWLSATLSYALIDPLTLQMSVRNDTSEAAPFDIMLIFFNTRPEVSYVQLVQAVSSLDGDNTGAWRMGHYGYDLHTVTFGDFDYSLRTEVGAPADHRIAPGETQHFTLSVLCASYVGCGAGVLDDWSENAGLQARAALLFSYGPSGDGAFGALTTAIPEPSTAALLGLGLLALAGARRRAGCGR